MKANGNSYEYQKIRGLKRKLYLIDLRGGCCEKCGYNKNLASFDFHHKDPSEKESQLDIRKLSNSSMKWVLKEFEKCEVVCANCHREIHNPELGVDDVRILLENHDLKKVIKVMNQGKPKCVDCGDEINYTYKRCNICSNKNKRKVERPDLELLQEELDNNGVTRCSKKYGVARVSIHRWLKKKIQ